MSGTKSAVVLTIRDAAKMTPEGRRDIARWLDRQKRFLLKHSQELSSRFTARYIYNDEE